MIQAINEMWLIWERGGRGLVSLFVHFQRSKLDISLLMLNFDITCMKSCLNVAIFFQEKNNIKAKKSLLILNGRLLF